MVERVFYKTNDGPPAKPSRPPMVGTPPQTYRHPVPPVVQQYPPQHPQQQPHNGLPVQYYRPAPGQYPQPVVQQQVVVQQKRGVNHVLHITLCFLTMGFWIPVYVLVCMFNA